MQESTYPKMNPQRILYLLVSAIIIVGFCTPFTASAAYTFDSPHPLYPKNYAITSIASNPPLAIPTFSWISVAGAHLYRLQVDNESQFTTPIFLEITSSNTSFTPQSIEQLLPDGEWFWRVRVEDP